MLDRFGSYVIALVVLVAFITIGSLELVVHGYLFYAYIASLVGSFAACALMISGLCELWLSFGKPDIIDYLLGSQDSDET
jgi:hypothetical protein